MIQILNLLNKKSFPNIEVLAINSSLSK